MVGLAGCGLTQMNLNESTNESTTTDLQNLSSDIDNEVTTDNDNNIIAYEFCNR